MKEEYVQLIIRAVNNISSLLNKEQLDIISESTKLFGSEGVLDSLNLVSLVVEIEQMVLDEHGVSIVLADDTAMSQKTSPFRNVLTLSRYIEKKISERGGVKL